MKKKVLIADDKKIYRRSLKNFLMENNLEIVGEAESGLELLDMVDKSTPDLLLVDIATPKCLWIDMFRWLRARYPDLKIMVLTLHEHLLKKALEYGDSIFDGCFLKYCDPDTLLSGIERVLQKETPTDSSAPEPFLCQESPFSRTCQFLEKVDMRFVPMRRS